MSYKAYIRWRGRQGVWGTREYEEWRTEVGILKWVVMSTDQSELDTVCVRARVCAACATDVSCGRE